MASLQASHSRCCALSQGRRSAAVTPFEIPPECDCQPTYYIDLLHDGKKVRQKVGRNRKQAVRELNKVKVSNDEGSFEPPRDLPFGEFADQWFDGLQRPKKSTKDGYSTTIDYAKSAFGSKKTRNVTPEDVARFLDSISASPSTKAKHLRVLGAIFRSAVKRGYAGRSPLDRLDDSHRPRAARRESPFFTDAELPRLEAELDGMHLTMMRLSYLTGLREGELAALTWADVNNSERKIHVRKAKTTAGIRRVFFTEDVSMMLAAWWAECGRPADDVLVFSTGTGPVPYWTFTKGILYPAMKRAGVDRVCQETGEKRTWHSLRHTYARRWIEDGKDDYVLSAQLGHSSVTVTRTVYAHFSTRARKLEVERVPSPI
jgi:integrase